ncbi:protein of unknown function [Sterolibacterium denitrificans]|uniref:Uncharacterized protein n=1 Tax=Sterolibacterium denitrificans TaxID=157592 RepID=A0A7Z7HSD4_9PROT|nr:protein of unknown function [Sterolibacterium denitrificans]
MRQNPPPLPRSARGVVAQMVQVVQVVQAAEGAKGTGAGQAGSVRHARLLWQRRWGGRRRSTPVQPVQNFVLIR